MRDLTKRDELFLEEGDPEYKAYMEPEQVDDPQLVECLGLLRRLDIACQRPDVMRAQNIQLGQLHAAIILAVSERDDILTSLRYQVAAIENHDPLKPLPS